MLRRTLIAASACGLALAGTAGVALAASPGAVSAPMAADRAGRGPAGVTEVHQINAHPAYLRALGHTRAQAVNDVIYGRGKRPPVQHRAVASTTCTEPNCPELYHDGPIQPTPHVYLVLWGPKWAKNTGSKATAAWLTNFYRGLGVSPDDHWSKVTSAYAGTNGSPSFGTPVFAGTYQDTSKPPKGVTAVQLSAEAEAAATALKITDLTDAQVVIATQSGTCPAGFDAPCDGTSGSYCAWNSETANGIPFTNLPYLLDAGANCGADILPSASESYDGFSIVGGAAYADTITNPLGSGWYDQFGSDGQLADKCAWTDPVTGNSDISDVTLSTGVFAMQPLFSNAALASFGDGCVMAAHQDTVSVSNPGTLTTPAGVTVSAALKATSSSGHPLTWAASGLPPGATIAVATGQLGGAPNAPGTYQVTVTASDKTGALGEAVFTWVVTNGQPVVGYGGLCLDDSGGGTADGNPIDIAACDGTSAQLWSAHPDGTFHLALGKCLTDPGTGGTQTGLVLSTCVGGATQKWSVQTNGELVLQANNLCLTDPQSSTTDGTQVEVRDCTGAADQTWTLP